MVGGRYVLGRLLGRGASGSVHAAQHAFTGVQVALKLIAPARGPCDDNARGRFFREARIAGSLDHPGVVRVLDAGIDEASGSAFIAMERLHGTTLGRWFEERRPGPRDIVEVMCRVTDALAHAHEKGLVHRDVKPGNVFVVPRDDGEYDVKLLDFGLCRGDGNDRVTRTGFLVGTPYYMSPERALEGDESLCPSADVWSVGAMLYEALSGAPPFPGQSPALILKATIEDPPAPLSGAHPAVSKLVFACLEKAPADRPPNGQALLERLVACGAAMDATVAVAVTPPPVAVTPAPVAVTPAPSVPDAMWLYCAPTDARALAPAPVSGLARALLGLFSVGLLSVHAPSPVAPDGGVAAAANAFEHDEVRRAATSKSDPPARWSASDWAGPIPPRAAVPKPKRATKKKRRRRTGARR